MINPLVQGSVDVLGRTSGELVISALLKNLDTKQISLGTVLIPTQEPASFSLDNLSSGNYDYTTVYLKNGNIATQIRQDEQEPSGEVSFSMTEDYTYLGQSLGINTKSKLEAIFNGEGFYNSVEKGGDVLVPVGTNGTDKEYALAEPDEMNLPFKYLVFNEADRIKITGSANKVTGKANTRKNPFAYSINRSNKTWTAEFRTVSGSSKVKNVFFPMLYKTELTWQEGDTNSCSITAMKASDFAVRDNYFFSDVEKYEENPTELRELEVNYIVVDGGGLPDTDVVDGGLGVIVDTDGNVTMQKYSGSVWEAETAIPALFVEGTRILAKHFVKGTAEIAEQNVFVVLDGDKKAVNFSADASNAPYYYCEVLNLNRETGKFEPFSSFEEGKVKLPSLS